MIQLPPLPDQTSELIDLWGDGLDPTGQLHSSIPNFPRKKSDFDYASALNGGSPKLSLLSTHNSGGFGVAAPTTSFMTPNWSPIGYSSNSQLRTIPDRTAFGGYNTPSFGQY